MAEKTKGEKVVFGINIDRDLKIRLKRYCAEHDTTLTEVIREAVVEYLQKREAK
jgi:ParG.